MAEFAIGLPLLMLGLWAMGHLLSSTWTTCRHLIADFTLQMEVRDAMSRIVDDMRSAQKLREFRSGVRIISYLDSGNVIVTSRDGRNVPDNERPIYYFRDQNTAGRFCIYRQRQEDAKSEPLTGGDLLSNVNVDHFKCDMVEKDNPRFWIITIEATSGVSNHKFKLMTMVYAEGVVR